MAERYLYLPLIGAFAIVGDLFQRLRMRAGPGGTTALLLSLILPFSILTASRNRDWKDNLSMNRSMIEVDPGYWLGHFEYGYESYLRGDRLTAAREFQITLEIARHSYYRAWSRYYLGALDLDLGQREKALDHFRAASRADPLNPAIHYAIASLLKAENDGLNAYREFLRTAALSLASLHLLSEVNNETSQPRVEQTTSAANMFPRPPSLSDAWKSYFHFASGAEQSYDPKDMQVLGGRRVVRTRHVLTKTDRQAYALRLIRYPLDNAREARFTFDIACEQNLYKMTYMEFRDEVGMILASGYPERESPVLHEYLMPGTPMRELADTVCTDRS